jgi:Tol biopolymer transport system component
MVSRGCGDWATEKNCDIYVKQIGVEPPSRLTDTPEQEYGAAWSPDGRFIAFLRKLPAGKIALLLIPQRGGHERLLAEMVVSASPFLDGPYLTWTPDSRWVLAPLPESDAWALYMFSVETGEKRKLTNPHDDEADAGPAFSPDGHTLAFARGVAEHTRADLYLLPLAEGYTPGGEPKKIRLDSTYNLAPAWIPDASEIVFASGGYYTGTGLWRLTVSAPPKLRELPFASSASVPCVARLGKRLAYSVERNDGNIWRMDSRDRSASPERPCVSFPRRARRTSPPCLRTESGSHSDPIDQGQLKSGCATATGQIPSSLPQTHLTPAK